MIGQMVLTSDLTNVFSLNCRSFACAWLDSAYRTNVLVCSLLHAIPSVDVLYMFIVCLLVNILILPGKGGEGVGDQSILLRVVISPNYL